MLDVIVMWWASLPEAAQFGIEAGSIAFIIICGLWYGDKKERRRVIVNRLNS